MYWLYRVTSLSLSLSLSERDVLWTWPGYYWYGSQTVAHPSVRVSRRRADTLNTNLASSFRPLFVGHSYLFQRMTSMSTSVYCWFSLLFLWLSWFSPAVLYALYMRVTLKVWWSIWHLLACHRLLLTFVYKNRKNRQFVPIYSKVIPQ